MNMRMAGYAGVVVTVLTACTVKLPADGVVDIEVTRATADAGAPTSTPPMTTSPRPLPPPPPPTTTTTYPTPPSHPAETCAMIAADSLPDYRGQFSYPDGNAMGIHPLDAYAFAGGIDRFDSPSAPPIFRQDFIIGFSETVHECRYRESSLAPVKENAYRIVFNHVAPAADALDVGVGTYTFTGVLDANKDTAYLERDTADRCVPPGATPGNATPATVTPLAGVLTVEERSADRIKLKLDLHTADGKVFTADVDVPICGEPQPNPNAPPFGCCL